MIDLFAGLYRRFLFIAGLVAPIALLLLRLGWGWELIESGYGHLTHIAQTTDFFTSLHIPFPRANVIMSGSTEFAGGVLLMLGLCARLISVPLFFNFCVAYLTASRDNVVNFFHQDPAKIIDDTAYPFLITSLIIVAFGPGLISIDALLARTVFKRYTKDGDAAHGFAPIVK
jgi:putative oxidoreductase